MGLLNATTERRAIAGTIVCGMLMLLAGCHLPELCSPEPGPPLPEDFNGVVSPESSAQLSVEEFFGDPILTHTIAQALASNQELKILNQEVQIANNEILMRRGAYLPFVALKGEAGLDKHSLYTPMGAAEEQLLYPGEHHFPDPLPNFLVGLDIFWQIDLWRELRNARDAAEQRYFAAIEQRNYFVTRLVAEIAENYYELLALDNRLQILDRIIGLQEKSLEFAEANKRAGRGTDLPVQRFQAEVRKNQSERLIVRQEIIEAENRINFLAGRYPQPVERASVDFINLNLHALSVGVPAQLLLYRRDIQEAERELTAAGLDVLVARARFFPRLDIRGTIGYEAFNPRYLFRPEALVADIAAGLVTPLINRAAIKADYQSANARQLQAVYNYQRVVLDAFTEVVNSLSKVENYRQSVEFKKEQMDALESSVEVAGRLFQSARAEYVEVLLAQRDLLDARTVLIETKQEQLSAVINAYQALGGGCWLLDSILAPPAEFAFPPPPEPTEAPAPPPLPAETTRREWSPDRIQMVGHATFADIHAGQAAVTLEESARVPGELAPPSTIPQPSTVPVEAGIGNRFKNAWTAYAGGQR